MLETREYESREAATDSRLAVSCLPPLRGLISFLPFPLGLTPQAMGISLLRSLAAANAAASGGETAHDSTAGRNTSEAHSVRVVGVVVSAVRGSAGAILPALIPS